VTARPPDEKPPKAYRDWFMSNFHGERDIPDDTFFETFWAMHGPVWRASRLAALADAAKVCAAMEEFAALNDLSGGYTARSLQTQIMALKEKTNA
jgi:hypothetical protein